jgi:uncharacterized protein with HEPN domain
MSKLDDPTRLGHMLDAATTAIRLITGETRESLNTDIKLLLALVKLIEIVGKAANNVSPKRQAEG